MKRRRPQFNASPFRSGIPRNFASVRSWIPKNSADRVSPVAGCEISRVHNRAGTTLTEVLMAILIMGIGIVMIATLFPASVLQSIAATKLTNATLLRYNAEGAIDTVPDQLVHNPDGNANFVEHHGQNYVVDPLGYYVMPAANQTQFGNGGGASIRRYPGGAADQSQAETLVTLPDSWRQQYTALVTAYDPGHITPPPPVIPSVTLSSIDPDDLQQLDLLGRSRIVLLDTTGRRSEVRTIQFITGLQVFFNGALTGGFTPTEARIESRDANYSWMLTVRNRGSGTAANVNRNANVDVVVFFRRTFVPEEERVYAVTGAGTTFTLNLSSGGNEPNLKKGGYFCDVEHGRWFRIQQIKNLVAGQPKIYTIYTDREPPISEVPRRVMFMPGVVDVFPLKVKVKGEQ